MEQNLRDFTDLRSICFRLQQAGSPRWEIAESNHDAAIACVRLDLAVGRQGQPFYTWQDQNRIGNACLSDRFRVDKIEIEPRINNLGNYDRSKQPLHRFADGVLPNCELCPGIIRGQQERDIIRGLALAEDIADPLQIARNVRHDWPPRIVIIERPGSVECPSRLASLFRRIRPSVPDKLIDSLQKKQVGFRFHIEWCRSKGGRMQPRPGFSGSNIPSQKVVRR